MSETHARLHSVPAPRAPEPQAPLSGVPLSVVFADGEELARVRDGESDELTLSPPFHVSDEDAYLVLPDDIGSEIVDILADGDADLLAEAMRDGLVVTGTVAQAGRGRVVLSVEDCVVPAELFADGLPYAGEVIARTPTQALTDLNALPHAHVTVCGALCDAEGLTAMLTAEEHIGISWRVPAKLKERGLELAPTLVWSRELPDGRVAVELALFAEYEELVVVLRPCTIARGD